MKNGISIFLLIGAVIASSCAPSDLEQKKADLKEYKSQVLELNQKIAELEEEISLMDTSFAKANRDATLVTTITATKGDFEHYIEVSGTVESRQNVEMSAENSGTVEKIYVKEGFPVKRGDILVRVNDDVLRNTISELETSLELAKTVYNRQSNLWENNIGTEIQYLEAKNKVESLERQLETAKSQLRKANVVAPFNGTVDKVFIKEGEMAQPGIPLVRLVSFQDMYIEAELSEAHIGKFRRNDLALVDIPVLDTTLITKVSAVGRVIDKDNRTFVVEMALPDTDLVIKPNQIAVVRLKDFESDNAVVVPTNLIQLDKRGSYVYVVDQADSVPVAKKVPVTTGMTYKNRTMILSGLQGDEKLVDEGFREVAEGHVVREVEPTI